MSDLALVISAPSGAGKTTLIKKLIAGDSRLMFAVSTTTRAIRQGEIEGESYYYVSTDDFNRMTDENEFAEWAHVHGNSYGTSKKEIDRIQSKGRIPVFDVDVQGAFNLKKTLANAVYVFIVPPSIAVLKERLLGRQTESADQIATRLSNVAGELSYYDMYDYIVVNDVIDDALSDMQSIIRAELCSRVRREKKLQELLGDAQ